LRRVELGEVIGNGIAVLNGLKPGERVVVSGATLLVDGEAVRVAS
jgi:multidrug efflux system membrane fusion protein